MPSVVEKRIDYFLTFLLHSSRVDDAAPRRRDDDLHDDDEGDEDDQDGDDGSETTDHLTLE